MSDTRIRGTHATQTRVMRGKPAAKTAQPAAGSRPSPRRDARPVSVKGEGTPTRTLAPAAKQAADYFYPMPTRAEVAGRGLPPEKWDEIKESRDAMIRRFNRDPVFRAEVIADHEREVQRQKDAAAE